MGVRAFLNTALVFIMVSLCGCRYDPFADKMTTVKPAVKDIVGTYIFERQTARDRDPRAGTIALAADGTFEANFTHLIADRNGELGYDTLIDTIGRWRIATVAGKPDPTGKTKDQWGITLTNMPRELEAIGLMGDKPPYKLIITYGDPDEGKVMIFQYLNKNQKLEKPLFHNNFLTKPYLMSIGV